MGEPASRKRGREEPPASEELTRICQALERGAATRGERSRIQVIARERGTNENDLCSSLIEREAGRLARLTPEEWRSFVQREVERHRIRADERRRAEEERLARRQRAEDDEREALTLYEEESQRLLEARAAEDRAYYLDHAFALPRSSAAGGGWPHVVPIDAGINAADDTVVAPEVPLWRLQDLVVRTCADGVRNTYAADQVRALKPDCVRPNPNQDSYGVFVLDEGRFRGVASFSLRRQPKRVRTAQGEDRKPGLDPNAGDLVLDLFCVAPNLRGRGIGGRFLEVAISMARGWIRSTRGVRARSVWLQPVDTARSFYRAHGFVDWNKNTDYMKREFGAA